MDLTRRFVFRGNASAFGGRLYRPKDIILEVPGASCLSVVGGRSRSSMRSLKFGGIIKIGAASTLAEGLFDNTKQALAHTFKKIPEDALTSTTTVNAQLADLAIGSKPLLTAKKVQATFKGRSPREGDEPSLVLTKETTIDGLTIDGFKLRVEFNLSPFQEYDTRAKLVAAANDPEFVKKHGDNFLMTVQDGNVPPAPGRLFERNGVIHATIVRSIRWVGAAHPTVTINHNTIVVPDFGSVFVGEMLISASSRRLTMLRFKLGSPQGGDCAGIDIDTNGSWSP